MNILVLHQAVSEESTLDERDVLAQRDAVSNALVQLGHETSVVPCTLNLDELRDELLRQRPDLVFNLVESLGGSDRLIGLVPLLLDTLAMPYTGMPSLAMQLTSSKTLAKRQLVQAGLPTLPWIDGESSNDAVQNPEAMPLAWPSRWIRKPIYEHASLGMTDEAVVKCTSKADVAEQTRRWQEHLGVPCLAEPFVEGREFNLSLLAGPGGPLVLPLAEIEFIHFPTGKPRIVGFAAKWESAAAEYTNTPRRFDFSSNDIQLLESLRTLALRCWQVFQLAGYCRVDYRVDELGQPWILEINANPCLAPDGGFIAAVERADMVYNEAIERIVVSALACQKSRPVGSSSLH